MNLTDAQRVAVEAWETVNNNSGEEFEFSDNYRYATVGNVEQMAAYDQRRGGMLWLCGCRAGVHRWHEAAVWL